MGRAYSAWRVVTFTIPAGDPYVHLSFDMFVNDWSGVGPIRNNLGLVYTNWFGANQAARVDLLTGGAGAFDLGPDVVRIFYWSVDRGTDPRPYVHYAFDLSSDVVPGRTYLLRFLEVENQGNLNMGVDNVSITAEPVPEPSSLALLVTGALPLVSFGRRPKKRNGTQTA